VSNDHVVVVVVVVLDIDHEMIWFTAKAEVLWLHSVDTTWYCMLVVLVLASFVVYQGRSTKAVFDDVNSGIDAQPHGFQLRSWFL
jgi:hypothetical protein